METNKNEEVNKIEVPNQHLADRIAGKVDEKGEPAVTPEEPKKEIPNQHLADAIAGKVDEKGIAIEKTENPSEASEVSEKPEPTAEELPVVDTANSVITPDPSVTDVKNDLIDSEKEELEKSASVEALPGEHVNENSPETENPATENNTAEEATTETAADSIPADEKAK